MTADVMWRFARACHDLALETTADKKKKEFLTRQGHASAKVALTLDEKNFACHKWMAIMLSDLGDFEGVKTKLLNAFVMKHHFEQGTLVCVCVCRGSARLTTGHLPPSALQPSS